MSRQDSSERPVLFDFFCGAGGCGVGYSRAGFEVIGVDIKPQPRYPFEFHQGDAVEFLRELRETGELFGRTPDVIHASPPCQGYANVTLWRGRHDDHPRLISTVRELVPDGMRYVMENVRTLELRPCVVLCGSMFGLPIRRHRGFETNWMGLELVPPCQHHSDDLAFMHKGERAYADAMGCNWMTSHEGREAIPPAYTEWIGLRLMREMVRSRTGYDDLHLAMGECAP